MAKLAEMLARFDALALPWQLVIMAGLALCAGLLLIASQPRVRERVRDRGSLLPALRAPLER